MKDTAVFHIIAGAITVGSGYFLSPVLGIGLWVSFLTIEVWNKTEWQSSQHDFWEYTVALFCSSGMLLLLKLLQLI